MVSKTNSLVRLVKNGIIGLIRSFFEIKKGRSIDKLNGL